jgi:adenine deaminase
METTVDTLVRGTLVNVSTGRPEQGCVAVDDGEVVALAERPADRVIEANYIAPGLIDAHLHVESSMVTIPRYADGVVERGVTGIVTDPHEAGNVIGEEGVRAMYADAEQTPLKVHFTVPSHVPVSTLQDSGATIGPDAVDRLLDHDSVVALGEVSTTNLHSESMQSKIQSARGRGLVVDGHLPSVTGESLQDAAYYLDTDHESITAEAAREKASLGLRVLMREGSSSKNLEALVPMLESVDSRRVSLCTDDRDVRDLAEVGGINEALRKAMACGIDPVEAVQMATINTAETYGLDAGRIKPGAPADLVLLDSLREWDVDAVCIDGVWNPTADRTEFTSAIPTDTVHFDPVEKSDLALTVSGDHDSVPVRVIDAVGGIQTAWREGSVPCQDGRLGANTDDDVLPMAVIERHGTDGSIGQGFVHGLGLDRGAIGSTLAHDAHNCIVAGSSHEAIATVANHLREIGGGLAVYDPASGDGLTTLALPLAGLMRDRPLAETADEFRELADAADEIGFSLEGGVTELSFLALEGIPECRLTNRGLVDVTEMTYVDPVRDRA